MISISDGTISIDPPYLYRLIVLFTIWNPLEIILFYNLLTIYNNKYKAKTIA